MNNHKCTLILGASSNRDRYSYLAAHMLKDAGIPFMAIGNREGEVAGEKIITEFPKQGEIHTITLYLGAPRQKQYYDDILQLEPKRIIFNPGTINPELQTLAEKAGIVCENACTLVMLRTGQY
jgi:predicted CoA-binding protein